MIIFQIAYNNWENENIKIFFEKVKFFKLIVNHIIINIVKRMTKKVGIDISQKRKNENITVNIFDKLVYGNKYVIFSTLNILERRYTHTVYTMKAENIYKSTLISKLSFSRNQTEK